MIDACRRSRWRLDSVAVPEVLTWWRLRRSSGSERLTADSVGLRHRIFDDGDRTIDPSGPGHSAGVDCNEAASDVRVRWTHRTTPLAGSLVGRHGFYERDLCRLIVGVVGRVPSQVAPAGMVTIGARDGDRRRTVPELWSFDREIAEAFLTETLQR